MHTIFATATAPLKSGVAIIRISGGQAKECMRILTGDDKIKPRQAYLRKLFNPKTGDLIDEALVLWFPGPASFTGEDTLELQVHGSRAVITELLEILSKIENVRMAEPGEFSRRAFENGKMDLTEAEGLADLIDAETKIQARQALNQKQGVLKDLYDKWRMQIISILANIEAYIDFPDEEIPETVIAEVEQQVKTLKTDLQKHLNDNRRGEKLRSGLRAIILGAPNAGKSSLLNSIAKRDVAIVSDIAGTTRDIIEVHLDLGGYPITIADTAGLREGAEAIETEGIKRAINLAEIADIKIALFDAATLPTIDKYTFDLLDDGAVVLINKSDLSANLSIPEPLKEYSPILISVKNQTGIAEFIAKLEKLAESHISISTDPVITRERHRSLLKETVEQLEKFDLNHELELASENLRQAALSLGRITGHIDVEEILDNIFSNFCIGK